MGSRVPTSFAQVFSPPFASAVSTTQPNGASMNRPLSLNGLYFGISIEDQMDKMSVPQVQVIADTLSITPGDGIRRRVLGALVKTNLAKRYTDNAT